MTSKTEKPEEMIFAEVEWVPGDTEEMKRRLHRPRPQNIPVHTELGAEIRRAFIGGEGPRLVSADYSQIELRILARLNAEKKR